MMKVGCYLTGLALVVLGGYELHRAACDQRVSLYAFINSDTLTCASFYEDILVEGYRASGFYFPTNTVLFPDCAMYFAARAITGAAAPAMILCSCLLFVLQLGGCYLLIRAVTPREQRWPQNAILLGLGALFLLVNARLGLGDGFFRLPLVLTYHAGSQVCLLFGMALLAYLLNAREGTWQQRLALAGLFVNSALGVASDRLLLVHLVAPGTGALLVTRLLAGGSEGGISLKKTALLSGVMVSGALSGEQLLRLFQTRWQDVINYYPYTLNHAWHSLHLLSVKWRAQLRGGDELHWFVTVTMAACCAQVFAQCLRRIVNRGPLEMSSTQRGLLFLSTLYLAMTATTVAAVCYSGLIYNPPHTVDFAWEGAVRYFLPVLFLPYFLAGLWLFPCCPASGVASAPRVLQATRGAEATPLARRLPAFVAIGLLGYVTFYLSKTAKIERADDQRVWNYCPPFVEKLDAAAEQYGLEYGLAGYWEAKVITLLSHRHLRVHQVIANPIAANKMVSFHWLSNARCYFDAPHGGNSPPNYQFILVKEFATILTPSRAELIQRFGPPHAEIPCGPYHLFIYDRPDDQAFQDVANRECYFMRGRYNCQLGESIRFDAYSLPSEIFGPYPPEDRTAVEDRESAGVLSGGPLLHLREAGTYRVKIVTSCPENEKSPGRWEIVMMNPKFGSSSIITSGDIVPGEESEAIGEVSISNRQRGRALECRVHFNGEGSLQMNYVEVTRIK